MQVVAHIGDFRFDFQVQRDADVASAFLSVQVRGDQDTMSDYLFIPYGSSYAEVMSLIRARTADLVQARLGITLGPDDTVQIYGGPQPTLADLGG